MELLDWKQGSKRTSPTSSDNDNDNDNDDENKVETRKSGRILKPVEKLVVSETVAKRSSKSKSKGKGRVVVDSEEEGDEAVDPSPRVSPIEEGCLSQDLDALSLVHYFDKKTSRIEDNDDDSDDENSSIREWRSVAKK